MSDTTDDLVWQALAIAEDNAEGTDVLRHIRWAMSMHQAQIERGQQ